MTGLVYKEWKQNKWFIIGMVICGALPLILLIVFYDSVKTASHYQLVLNTGSIVGILIAGMLQVMTLGGDDRKLWAYFISASPDGSKGFIRVKYEMIFFMILTFLLSIHFFDNLILMFTIDKGIEGVYDAGNMVLPLIFLQIFLRAVDIPFTYRFGAKKGSIIKMILMVLCAITMLIVIMINIDDLDVIIDGIKDKMAHYSETPLIPAILVSTLIAYYISYLISCRLYMKGAELYDK